MYVNKYVKLGYKSTKKNNKIFHLGNFDEDSFGSELLTNVVKFLISLNETHLTKKNSCRKLFSSYFDKKRKYDNTVSDNKSCGDPILISKKIKLNSSVESQNENIKLDKLDESEEDDFNSEDEQENYLLQNRILVARKLYRLQCIYTKPADVILREEEENSRINNFFPQTNKGLIEWDLDCLEKFTGIINGFSKEGKTQSEINEIFCSGLSINIVNFSDFSYLGPLNYFKYKEKRNEKKPEETQINTNYIVSTESKKWNIYLFGQLTTSLRTDNNKPSNIHETNNNNIPSVSTHVFVTQNEVSRILDNYKNYFSYDTILTNSERGSALYLALPVENKSLSGNSLHDKDPTRNRKSRFFLNPSLLGNYNTETLRFENNHLTPITETEFTQDYIRSEINNINKFSYWSGDDFHYNNLRNQIKIDENLPLKQIEELMCKNIEKQYIFNDFQDYCNKDKGIPFQDNYDLIEYKLNKLNEKEKIKELKISVKDRYVVDRLRLSSTQIYVLVCCTVIFLKPKTPHFEVVSIAHTGLYTSYE